MEGQSKDDDNYSYNFYHHPNFQRDIISDPTELPLLLPYLPTKRKRQEKQQESGTTSTAVADRNTSCLPSKKRRKKDTSPRKIKNKNNSKKKNAMKKIIWNTSFSTVNL